MKDYNWYYFLAQFSEEYQKDNIDRINERFNNIEWCQNL